MSVIEASAMVDALADDPATPELLALLADEELHAPALLDFDAAYVVLALGLEAPLVTSDTKMQEARRLGVHVQIIPAS